MPPSLRLAGGSSASARERSVETSVKSWREEEIGDWRLEIGDLEIEI
jgi:subtilisin-like proprotein convertase family protein